MSRIDPRTAPPAAPASTISPPREALIRSDQNELWGVSRDRTALRAVVSDAVTGRASPASSRW